MTVSFAADEGPLVGGDIVKAAMISGTQSGVGKTTVMLGLGASSSVVRETTSYV